MKKDAGLYMSKWNEMLDNELSDGRGNLYVPLSLFLFHLSFILSPTLSPSPFLSPSPLLSLSPSSSPYLSHFIIQLEI